MKPIRCMYSDNCPPPAYKVTKTEVINDLGYHQDTNGDKTPMAEGYWIVGKFTRIPAIGESLLLFRILRNGVVSVGEFESTPIIAIAKGDHEITFHTHNSAYRVEEYLEPLPPFPW